MIRLDGRRRRWPVVLLALVVLGVACGDDDGGEEAAARTSEPTFQALVDRGPLSGAAQARSDLGGLLTEHVQLMAAATNAALGGRTTEFAAVNSAVEANTAALTGELAETLGNEAGSTFDPLWKRHIELFVNYTQGLAAKDKAKQEQAVADLAASAGELGTFVNSVLPALEREMATDLFTQHVATLRAVVDAQAAGDQGKAFTDLQAATRHMGLVAEHLATGMAARAPDRVGGEPGNAAAGLVTALHLGLREHVFLISAATGAALGGRAEEFSAAAGALDANTGSITEAISGVYGADTGEAFTTLWKKHITFLVEYTTGHAANDKPARDRALESLAGYPAEFGAFFSTASPALTAESLSELVNTHITILKDVIDAQSTRDVAGTYTKLRTALDHVKSLANPLAEAAVAQFPDQFGTGEPPRD